MKKKSINRRNRRKNERKQKNQKLYCVVLSTDDKTGRIKTDLVEINSEDLDTYIEKENVDYVQFL